MVPHASQNQLGGDGSVDSGEPSSKVIAARQTGHSRRSVMFRPIDIQKARQETHPNSVNDGGSPSQSTILATVSMMRLCGELSFIDMKFPAFGTVNSYM